MPDGHYSVEPGLDFGKWDIINPCKRGSGMAGFVVFIAFQLAAFIYMTVFSSVYEASF